MSGFDICQRQTMTVNHGLYYVDLTASFHNAKRLARSGQNIPKKNVFVGGNTYDFFLLYAKEDTEQTYQMYVGPGFKTDTDVKLIRADIRNAPFKISSGTPDPKILNTKYDSTILKVTLNLKAFANDFASAAKGLCVPQTFCNWNGSKCVGKAGVGNLTADERDIACGYAGKDKDCPTGGCVGFSVKLPSGAAGFQANDQTTTMEIPAKHKECFPKDTNWNVNLKPLEAPSSLAGTCYQAPMKADFCQQ